MRAGRPTVELGCTWVAEPAIVTETEPFTAVTEMRSGSWGPRDDPASAALAVTATASATRPAR